MGLFDLFRRNKKHPSSGLTREEGLKIYKQIKKHNKEIEVVREDVFQGEGKPYCYYYDNGSVRAEGLYYALGYDKSDRIQDEKFQGKNVEYHENGQIKDVFFTRTEFLPANTIVTIPMEI